MSSSVAKPFPSHEEQVIPPHGEPEADLGEHLLLIRADHSIELCTLCDEARSGVGKVLTLDHEEVYYLFISLKEVFK